MRSLTITRNRGYYGIFRALKLYVDDVAVGDVKSGKSVQIVVPDDAGVLYGKMDWGRTNSLPLKHVTDGQTLYANASFSFNLLRGLGLAEIPITLQETQ